MDKTTLRDFLTSEAVAAGSRQEYGGSKPRIDGVSVTELPVMFGEDGLFVELARLNEKGETKDRLPPLQLAQINYSETVSGQIKAWHFHLKQDEIWLIPPTSQLIVGLLDLREASPTRHQVLRYALGNGKMHAVMIPRGVAHGLANPYQRTASIFYFVSNVFDGTDEWRLPHDFKVGPNFWAIQPG